MTDHPMESMLGPTLLTKIGAPTKVTKKLLADKDLVLLYFSASWCPPCKLFSPILSEFYTSCGKEGKIEIVYVSSDRDVPSFEEYYGKMPFLSIPYVGGSAAIKTALSQTFKIKGIPTLVVVDAKTGEFVSNTAREQVTHQGKDKAKCLALIEMWKTSERVPLSEIGANEMPQDILGLLKAIFFWFRSNPTRLIFLFYTYKYLKQTFFPPDAVEAALAEADDVGDVPITSQDPDSEF
jgi:nucleoredoxin